MGKTPRKELEQTLEKVLYFEARSLLDHSTEKRIVSEVFQNRTIQELQKLARIILTEDEKAIVLFVSQNENRLQLVGARGSADSVSMKRIIGDALTLINGKGGGSDSFAQGGGEALIICRPNATTFS